MCDLFANFLSCFIIFNIFYLTKVRGKYVEGEINSKDDWAFLARFCFLSEEGQFEYRIEFNEEQGYPNLLLYYDTDDQWPSVYKSGKTCSEKESVLKIGQNQVVNLTVKTIFHQEFSGCMAIEKWKPPVITSSTTTQFPTKKYTEPIFVKKKTSSTFTSLSTTSIPTRSSITSTTITTTNKPIYFQSTTDFSTEILDNFNTSNTPELYDYNDESLYHNFQDDVENIFPNDDRNETGPIEVYTTTASSPRKKRSIMKNTTPKQQRRDRRIICQNSRRFRSSRERWWFIAVSNCGGNKGINIKYKLLMTNGPSGDYWHEHFSADEFYVLPVLLAYSVAYSFLLLAVIVCTIELKARQLLHSTYKLFTCSVSIQFFGVVFKTLAYMKFAFNGLGSPKLKTFGEILMAYSETCFLLVLILLAKGYTVTRGRLSVKSGVKVTIFMCIYSVTYICLFVYQEKVFDPGEVLYLYESPAGYGLIFLKIIAWIMFIYSTIITLKHYPEKSNFYYPFNVFGTFWFVAGPAFILSANTYIDKWVRESVVKAVLLLITFGGHLMFLVLTMPSRANKNFPYHVRTTQIGIMEVAGLNSPGHFNHYPYEPSADPYEQTVIIPLTKRTEELFGGIYAHKLNSSTRSTNNIQNNLLKNVEERRLDVDAIPDSRMQNVLSWAIAKDGSSLSVPTFERVYQGDSFRSTRSRGDEIENPYSSPTFGVQKRTEFPRNDFSDYIKDVPVELFTVSKMVVTTTCQNNNGKDERND